ncbi:S8 family serine peptidase [Nocardioides solisilvae]|uniref:S8 family serine peptidase n=1 Tax=Nocardioides solisilvae TaxID=1542435 RepID=UPI0013A576B4|nr:S8 family serine peptidase [Nocardioides solisilvae]
MAARLAGALALVPAVLLSPVTPPAAAAGEDACSRDILPDTERTRDVGDGVRNLPLERMNVPLAHRVTKGAGSTVAVVDSGVGFLPGKQVRQEQIGFAGPFASGHGTIVAGLIAGPDGVAPDARLISVRVLDKDSPDLQQGQRGLRSENLAAALERLAQVHASDPIDVVNVSLALPANDTRVEAAVKRLLDLDVVVVAAAGNVDPEAPQGPRGRVGGDAVVFPADYPGVVAVSAVGPSPAVDVRDYVVPNAETTVAAPGGGGLSYNLNGQRCQVPTTEVATSWAAASVSGVVALLRARFPDENRKQVVARLTRTAEGSELAPNPWTGAGVVQAADALTHELSPKGNGTLRRTETVERTGAQAPPPPDRPDVFGPSRTMLLWFGLLAGALVALAFVARPLLRRRSG